MHLHPLSLAFSGPDAYLEKPYRQDYFTKSLRHVRVMMILGIFLYSAFGILDGVLLPEHKHITWMIRFGVGCPIILLGFLISFHRRFRKLMQPVLSVLVTICGCTIVWMIVIAPPPVNYSYYAGLIIIILYGYTLVRLRFVWSSAAGWILVALYEIAAIGLTDTPLPILINNNFFFISANLTGMLAGYAMERFARRDFFLAHLVAEEKEKVTQANLSLERRVQDRTAELQKINSELEREIAERKRTQQEKSKLEHQLKQAERMETIGRLAAGVAHDLNNILSGLVSYPDILRMDLPEDSPLRKPIDTIQKSGLKAAAVVQDLLSLSRQGVTVKAATNLNMIVREYLQSPEFKALQSRHSEVRFETQLQKSLLNVDGSQVHLFKTVMNLTTNAAEANLTGGVVTVATLSRYLDQAVVGYETIQEGEYSVLRISDSGTGMAEKDLKKIFEPFYSKKKLGRSGTGLGMTLVWSTVKEHDGYINIQSEEGRGTTFEIYFPVTRKKIHETEQLLSLADCRGTESVLVVDDVQEQREIASRMLRKLGYEVNSVESGEAAIAYLKLLRADILILDMIMEPGIDGCETFRQVVKTHPGQKAIITSGFSRSDLVKEAQRLGAGVYVKKPYTMETLARAVREELGVKASSCEQLQTIETRPQ